MTQNGNEIPPKLQEMIEDFQWAEGKEKLELLLQYSEQLSPLPGWLQEKAKDMEQVHECMSPVFVAGKLENGRMRYYLDVPKSAPTVRGFAAFLEQALNDLPPEKVLAIPGDFYQQMGLEQALSHQRLNGISAILAHMKSIALREMHG